MSKLHVFIDGTWLFEVVEGNVFDRFLVTPKFFDIDFTKLNNLLLNHIKQSNPDCTEIGDCFFVTSLFDLPSDFDSWENKTIKHLWGTQSITVNHKNIETTRINVKRRNDFAQNAISAGYKSDTIFHIPIQEWMLLNLLHKELRYQEKQVDTTVVALLIRYAIENKNDCFALVAGDADILPAINTAYPNYTKNVFPVLTSPGEKDGRNKQTSFKYTQYSFNIPTVILTSHVGEIMEGNVYQCTECHKYFSTLNPIPASKLQSGEILPRCKNCR